MRRDTLPIVILRGRYAGELLAHPCACGTISCTLGAHIWDATRNMTPGPKAQSFEPETARGFTVVHDGNPRPDPTAEIDLRFRAAIKAYWDAAEELIREMDRLRPDRFVPLPEPASDDQWCANHLEVAGMCEPRFRGDLCRWCYELGLAYNAVPDLQLMTAKQNRGYSMDRDIKQWRERQPKQGKTKRKPRSRLASYG